MPLTLVQPPDLPSTDSALAVRVAQGDRRALTSLMRRYNQRLYRVARSILRNDADAEEAVQEAFYLAYCAMAKFRGDSSLATWLTRIVVNESTRRLRKNNRLSAWMELSETLEPFDAEFSEGLAEGRPEQPEQAMERQEMRRLIEEKIDELPAGFRTVFVMRAVEELSVEEVANCLDIPAATVRTRYFRARSLLRKLMARDVGAGLGKAFSFAGARCDRIVAAVQARIERAAAPPS
ncbi:MAG: RNA polymerase sigma factor [Burkholderiaceae bacterium]|nr:MAG: RNA polymerase sigma factor [Burkholderiaceae bacterium]TAM05715.1 MAG: RNA polymerase sigma factor [Pusillimonas sp.]